MLKIATTYANAEAPSANYPGGSFKNKSAPSATDGTPLEKAWANDMLGFSEALLAEAGITPSEVPDTAVNSDRLNALKALFIQHALAVNVGDMLVATAPGVFEAKTQDEIRSIMLAGAISRLQYDSISTQVSPIYNVIPTDGTPPLASEGYPLFTVNAAAKKATSKIKVHGMLHLSHSHAGGTIFITVFKDSSLIGAFMSGQQAPAVYGGMSTPFDIEIPAVDTDSHEYQINIGVWAGGYSCAVNPATWFGNSSTSFVAIDEIIGA